MSGSYTLNEDTPYSNSLVATDPELSTLTYTIDTLPSNGVLQVSATGAFTYTPNANYYGPDQFDYHVSDGSLNSS